MAPLHLSAAVGDDNLIFISLEESCFDIAIKN